MRSAWLAALLALWLGGAAAMPTAERTTAPTADATEDRIAERGVLVDPGGLLELQDVLPRAFAPYRSPYSQGSARAPLWLRLVVPPQPADTLSLVLLIQPPILRDIQVYTPDGHGGWQRQDLGTRHAFRDRPRSDLNFAMKLTASAERPTVLYLRVDTQTSTVHAEVVTPDAARELDARIHVGMGVYFGLALVLASLSVLMWWSTRDSLWASAAAFDVLTMLHSALVMGFVAKYVLPGMSEAMPWLSTLSSATHLAACCVVFSMLARALQAPRWVWMTYLSALPFYAFWLVMIAFGQLGQTLVQVNQFMLFASLWGLVAIATIRAQDRLLAWTYRVFVAVLVAYLLMWVLPMVRPGGTNLLSLYPTLPTNLTTMLMVSLILARRTLLAMRERHRLEHTARETEQRFRLEQAHHAETEGMLSMIVHEMKNPLASIRLASELLSSGRTHDADEQRRRFRSIWESVDSIDTVLNRCMDVDRLEQGKLREQRSTENVAGVLREWVAALPSGERIALDAPDTLSASVDVHLWLLMIGNLLDNALKYSPPEAGIGLRLRERSTAADDVNAEAQATVECEVRNPAGRAGFPDPQRLFQKYYRSPGAQYRSGTGLGMYWVHRVVGQIGGRVDYRRDDDDVVFTLTVPA